MSRKLVNIFEDVSECVPSIGRYYPHILDPKKILSRGEEFANFLDKNFKKIKEVLLKYESFEVALDETNRSIDLFKSLKENKQYFKRRVGQVTTFLPRNQPLYALSCFGLLPSLMAEEVHIRPPTSMMYFFNDLAKVLKLKKYFPNIHISYQQREKFLDERTAITFHKDKSVSLVSDIVIFTGTMENADKMRKQFSTDVFFIANGAGHNPIVVSKDADIEKAVEGASKVQLYNQGQDCANPNAILVHDSVYESFIERLKVEISNTKIGPYSDVQNRIGPISDRKALLEIQETLVENSNWLNDSTPGVIRTKSSIVEPTIIEKPLSAGGNFTESFAPLFFVQRYKADEELKLYFEDPRYERNAMYVTLYGTSPYVDSLANKKYGDNKILHSKSTLVKNKDLHAPGIERGTQPYGGFGRGASCVSLFGKVYVMPTLAQRDIYEFLVKPNLKKKKIIVQNIDSSSFFRNKHQNQNLEKTDWHVDGDIFIDLNQYETVHRIIKLDQKKLIVFLENPNSEYFEKLSSIEKNNINQLVKVIRNNHSLEEIETLVFDIPKRNSASKNENKTSQKLFFKNVYNLLLGKDFGPRLGPLLHFGNKKRLLSLLTNID